MAGFAVRYSNLSHLCFVGFAAAGRPDAAHGPELHLQDTLGHAEGNVAGDWRRYWLARPRNCRTGHHAAAVIV